MKKYLLSLLAVMFVFQLGLTQDDPVKAMKKAARDLGAYNLDPENNLDKLEEARDLIDFAAKAEETKGMYKTWQTRGEVYAAPVFKEVTALSLSQGAEKPKTWEYGLIAAESYAKALELAQKKFEKRDALKGLKDVTGWLNYFGNLMISHQDYEAAYMILDKVLYYDQVLRDNGGDPALATPEDVNNTKFIVAYTAMLSGDMDRAKQLFMELYESGYDDPGVYANLFQMLIDEDEQKAVEILEEGRRKYPEDTEILFAEINYYIQQENYEVLKEKLAEAIEREPDNPSVYTALGNVYMNLFNQEYAQNGDSELAQQYFDEARKYFEKAIELNPQQYDAIYSLGSLYYNKAVEIIKKMNELGLSKEDQRKYEEYGKQVDALFAKALPYFQQAEAINPSDRNTLIALKEIYARQNNFELSNEFKQRLETVEAGGTIEKSYFGQ